MIRTDNAPKVRFSAKLRQEPELELSLSLHGLLSRLDAYNRTLPISGQPNAHTSKDICQLPNTRRASVSIVA